MLSVSDVTRPETIRTILVSVPMVSWVVEEFAD